MKMTIGTKIQTLRKQRGLSQEQLAETLGVSRQAVSKWEAEQSVPDIDKIILNMKNEYDRRNSGIEIIKVKCNNFKTPESVCIGCLGCYYQKGYTQTNGKHSTYHYAGEGQHRD